MNQTERDKWIAEAIHYVLLGLARNKELSECLIFKGARILNFYLNDSRESLDLDSNLDTQFVASLPELEKQKHFLETHISAALRKFFEEMVPVRFKLNKVSIQSSPPKEHPQGWDAFQIRLSISDRLKSHVLGLPSLDIDVAAPETLGLDAVEIKEYYGSNIRIYALHRIAGEKLRAFLSTLPAYRAKVEKPGTAIRVKDLHDLARILRARPIDDDIFWNKVGFEFRLACQSRYIDCQDLSAFFEDWKRTRQEYHTDTNLELLVPWLEVENSIKIIALFLEREGYIPIICPLPANASY